MELDWLEQFVDSWQDRILHDRVPHAVLLAGPAGVGKRAAAHWIAATTLGIRTSRLPVYPQAADEHPDLRWVAPLEDKESIGIDQIRELVHAMALTSYEGGGKVAVIEPANAMTVSAANSLLVLVADRVGKLPATVFSRCQRIDLPAPAETVALAWLDRVQPGASWTEALRVAGGGPLAAIAVADHLETSASMARDSIMPIASGLLPIWEAMSLC